MTILFYQYNILKHKQAYMIILIIFHSLYYEQKNITHKC